MFGPFYFNPFSPRCNIFFYEIKNFSRRKQEKTPDLSQNVPEAVEAGPQSLPGAQLPEEDPQGEPRGGAQAQVPVTDGEAVPEPGPEGSGQEQKIPQGTAPAAQGPQEGIPDPQGQPQAQGPKELPGGLRRGRHRKKPPKPRLVRGSS